MTRTGLRYGSSRILFAILANTIPPGTKKLIKRETSWTHMDSLRSMNNDHGKQKDSQSAEGTKKIQKGCFFHLDKQLIYAEHLELILLLDQHLILSMLLDLDTILVQCTHVYFETWQKPSNCWTHQS